MNLLLVSLDSTESNRSSSANKILALIDEMEFEGHKVATLTLPAVWDECFAPLEKALTHRFDAIVCLADKECEVLAIERVAINETDASIKDGKGRRPRLKEILPGGSPGHWSGLPYRELSIALTDKKLEAKPSHSAGKGLANFVFYKLMQRMSEKGITAKAGLIQIPTRWAQLGEEACEAFCSCLISTIGSNHLSEGSLAVDLSRFAEHARNS